MEQLLRLTSRPSKQLLWIWLRQDMAKSSQFDRGLDIACAEMENRRFFQTRSYTGVDIDAERLAIGAKANPGVTAIHSPMESMPSTLQGDFVLCVQTIGTNKLFSNERTLPSVENIVAATASGGTLLFNIGPGSLGHSREVEKFLARNFGYVRKRVYGAFNDRRKRPAVSVAIARLMQFLPPLRATKKRPFIYYVCSQRLADSLASTQRKHQFAAAE
jgi:hypothetical protein